MEQSWQNRIRSLAVQLPPCPAEQFPAPDGHPGEPDGILIQRRCNDVKINPGQERLRLYHKRFVLTIALQQEGLICVNDLTCPILPNYAFLIYPYQYHHYILDQNDFFWLVVTFELDRMFYPESLYCCSVPVREFPGLLLARMLEVYLERGSSNPLVRRHLNSLLVELDTEPCRITAGNHLPATDRKVRLFEEINGYICLHLADPGLSVERIARKHGVSKSYLYTIFTKMLGCQPAEYIRQLRLREACRLLKSGRWMLSEIAVRTGFSSLSVFSRSFRQAMGCTPSEFQRKSLSQQKEAESRY